MKHDQLVIVARQWLRRTWRCPVVVSELVTNAMEIADAIGWTSGGRSIVIECKASRADFRADGKTKNFRATNPQLGMGDYRFFLAVAGVIPVDELPPGWGLLEVTARGVSVTRRSHEESCGCEVGEFAPHQITGCIIAFSRKAHDREALVLMSLLRRMSGPGVRGRAVAEIDPYTNDEHGNAVTQAEAVR